MPRVSPHQVMVVTDSRQISPAHCSVMQQAAAVATVKTLAVLARVEVVLAQPRRLARAQTPTALQVQLQITRVQAAAVDRS